MSELLDLMISKKKLLFLSISLILTGLFEASSRTSYANASTENLTLSAKSITHFATRTHASNNENEGFTGQIYLIDQMVPLVEKGDLGRLHYVKKSIQAILENIEKNLKEGRIEITVQTLKLIQNLVIQYRYSQVYFGWTTPRSATSIYTPFTSPFLERLKKNNEQMVLEFGYDELPYSQITANAFHQMHALLKQLEALPIPADLKNELRALWMPIGETIALAEQGDRPKTFAKAALVIKIMRSLYPMFDRISATDVGYALVMELQGLTEYYADYAQVVVNY